ncbi:hypothetical protein [Xylocopilactobacillus apis]|uniref:Uncharacterized protein n=1 Tax=Xylocopilactobacillus apis TaxID=2932183 RepID=A0AAU9CTT4_9LACO|nr:hypothetical protein [Xylocopilactobacillus apis]BDR55761.1 hypothetical protein KIMC2_03230 [Xylocopilactobacillus apis]
MTLDDEIRIKISQLLDPPEMVDSWKRIADNLSDSFDWKGTKIDWSKTINHKSSQLLGNYPDWLSTIRKFIADDDINVEIKKSQKIYYINDSSLDFAVCLTLKQFNKFLAFAIENIPQHHYFFDFLNKWCLVISFEGYVDFCLSQKKISLIH